MKQILIAILFSVIVTSPAFSQSSKKEIDKLHLPWIKFNWLGDSLGYKYFDKAAILIPIKIDDLPYTNLAAQFDLGADTTMFYGKSLKPFLKDYPELLKKTDTTLRPYVLNGDTKGDFLLG